MSKYLGRVAIRFNGLILDSKPGASIDLGGTQRDSVVNEHTMGYTEAPKQSSVECELALKQGDSVEQYRNVTNATLVFETDTGQRYIVKAAFIADTPVISSAGVKLKFMGEPAQEMVS
jgi:hypothetical protein